VKQNIVLSRPAQVNLNWAQKIVSHHAAGAMATDVKILSMTVGTTTRIKIKVNHDVPELVPSSWFVKTPSLLLKSRLITALPQLLQKEIYFYQSLSEITPLKLPRVLAAQSQFGIGSTLVMSDLEEHGFSSGKPSDALSIDQARRVIAYLAKLHAKFWENQELLKSYRWLSGFNSSAEEYLGNFLAVPLMQRGLDLASDKVPKALKKPALRYAANRKQIMKKLAAGAQTLVHHDCHPGNFFWNENEPGFLDWQLVRRGEGIGDVAYFLATALLPEQRRANEEDLLELYSATLSDHGVQYLDKSGLLLRYRAHLSYALEAMVITLAIGDLMDTASNIELIRRAACAVEDHDSYSTLFED
jgi:aminoglycoside/choline kinase family phosphotransferase